jgi:arylsulfatase
MSCWSSLGRNWANASNTPYRYFKNDSYEGGICTPLITYWPKGIKNGGRITDHNGHFIDIMATVIDITGAKYPRELRGDSIVPYEGESLVPVFNETERPRKKPLFWQWQNGKAIMKDNWKLVSKKKDGKDNWELFDMETDKTETTDLSAKHPEVVSELKSLHKEWLIYCAEEQR